VGAEIELNWDTDYKRWKHRHREKKRVMNNARNRRKGFKVGGQSRNEAFENDQHHGVRS